MQPVSLWPCVGKRCYEIRPRSCLFLTVEIINMDYWGQPSYSPCDVGRDWPGSLL